VHCGETAWTGHSIRWWTVAVAVRPIVDMVWYGEAVIWEWKVGLMGWARRRD